MVLYSDRKIPKYLVRPKIFRSQRKKHYSKSMNYWKRRDDSKIRRKQEIVNRLTYLGVMPRYYHNCMCFFFSFQKDELDPPKFSIGFQVQRLGSLLKLSHLSLILCRDMSILIVYTPFINPTESAVRFYDGDLLHRDQIWREN